MKESPFLIIKSTKQNTKLRSLGNPYGMRIWRIGWEVKLLIFYNSVKAEIESVVALDKIFLKLMNKEMQEKNNRKALLMRSAWKMAYPVTG